MATISFYFYDTQRDLNIGGVVTFAQAKFGEIRGERATLRKVDARYAEFVSETGSVVKVYAQNAGSYCYYLGHKLPKGWEQDGWFIDTNPNREIVKKHPEYLHTGKSGFEWRDR